MAEPEREQGDREIEDRPTPLRQNSAMPRRLALCANRLRIDPEAQFPPPLRRTRRLAGFALTGNRRTRRHEDEGCMAWPHDALRHSFASYHLAKFQNAPALALELGHQSNALIFSNHRRRVTEAEAADYFDLTPRKSNGVRSLTRA